MALMKKSWDAEGSSTYAQMYTYSLDLPDEEKSTFGSYPDQGLHVVLIGVFEKYSARGSL